MDLETDLPFRYRQPIMTYVEDVEKYLPGGFHPVDIGDRVGAGKHTYQVIHKLGHGGSSTVWLVRSYAASPSYFALKILRVDIAGTTADRELSILQHLKTVAGHGHPNVAILHDSFKVSGPNGEHHCLIFPVLGPSISKVRLSSALSSATRYQMCQQVASAMAFLHRHGVCHGDFTIYNLAFAIPSIQSMSPEGVTRLLGPIRTEKLKLPNGRRSPHGPNQVVQTPDFSGLDYSLLLQVRVIDFGEAFLADHPPPSLGVPLNYFPPELCFGYLPSKKSDVWQLACILYQIHTVKPIFPTFFRIFEMLIGTIVPVLGPIPQHWRRKYNFDKYGYVEPGRELDSTEPEYKIDGDSRRRITSTAERRSPGSYANIPRSRSTTSFR